MQDSQRLSDSRSSKRGIAFFRFWYRVWGYEHTRVMVWFVTFFYMIFDREARRRAEPYIRHRFPGANIFVRLKHTWFLFAHQGMSLLQHELFDDLQLKYKIIYDSGEARKVRHSERAAVVVYSHFGPWQAMMRSIVLHENPINILAQPDNSGQIDKMKSFADGNSAEVIRQITPGSGSLLLAQQALENNEFVTMMGDRCFESSPMEVEFLGDTAYFPIAAYHLAARMNSPLVCIFAHWQDNEYVLEFCEAMYPEMKGRNREQLRPYLEKYTRHLEKLCMEYPYDCFSMFDHWDNKYYEK